VSNSVYEMHWISSLYLKDYDTLAGCYSILSKKFKKLHFVDVLKLDISEAKMSFSYELKIFDSDITLSIKKRTLIVKCKVYKNSLVSSNQFKNDSLEINRLFEHSNLEQKLYYTSPAIAICYIIHKLIDEISNEIPDDFKSDLVDIKLLTTT
jgi:hypothetical protein